MPEASNGKHLHISMKRFLYLPLSVFSVCALPACDREQPAAAEDAEAPLREERIAQVESERREFQNVRDEALDRELEEARRQLQIALLALEENAGGVVEEAAEPPEEDEGSTEGKDTGPEAGAEPQVDEREEAIDPDGIPGVARAIVVEEAPLAWGKTAALQNVVPVALLEAGDHQIFFAELSRFGDWFETSEYGFVWQPADLRTNPAWRPYTRGRWVHSDQGWTWLSDEPFGWAVYHYGRWVLLAKQGWVWVPGDDWAPAWVSWRQNDDYLGWAPLPPETLYDDVYDYDPGIDVAYDVAPEYYNFVPVDYFYEPVEPYCVPRVRVTTIVINTRNVTRFAVHERRIHCNGPDLAWVNHRCRRAARPCRIDFGREHEHFAHRHRHRLHDDALQVFAPRVNAPWNAAVCPGRVSGHLGRVDVVRAGKRRMERNLVVRHQRAALRRHEVARQAVSTTECKVALRQNIRRQHAEQEAQLTAGLLIKDEHQLRQAEAESRLRAASDAVSAAERRVKEGGLEPARMSKAKRSIKEVQAELARAREALHTRMENRGSSSSETKAGREGPPQEGPVAEEKRAGTSGDANSGRHVHAGKKRDQHVIDMLRDRQDALAKRAMEQAKARPRVAEQEAAGDSIEDDKRALRQAGDEEQSAQDRKPEAAAQAIAENRRRTAEQKATEGVARNQQRGRAARGLEKERGELEDGTEASDGNKGAERREAALAQQKAESAKRELEARQKAEEARRQALAQQRAEEVKRRALAQQRADESRKRALAQEKAEEARQRMVAQQKAEEARKRVEYEARRRAQVESQRRAAEERARADAQRRAAAEQAKARAEIQRRTESEARRRAAIEQARRQAQAEATRRQSEAGKKRSNKRR